MHRFSAIKFSPVKENTAGLIALVPLQAAAALPCVKHPRCASSYVQLSVCRTMDTWLVLALSVLHSEY